MLNGRRIRQLVERTGTEPVEWEALRELVYLLEFPETPPAVAGALVQRTELCVGSSRFPSNLAYGVLDSNLEYRSASDRDRRTRKYFRQIHLVGFHLDRELDPSGFVHRIEDRFALLNSGALIAIDLGNDDLPNGNLRATLVEELVRGLAEEPELMVRVVKHVTGAWSPFIRHRFRRRITDVVQSALATRALEGIDETDTRLLDPHGPIRFTRARLEDDRFVSTARDIEEILKRAA